MIVIGAKGFAKEVLQVLSIDLKYSDDEILFFDNISSGIPDLLYNRFKVLKSFDEVTKHLQKTTDKDFVLGIGNPTARKKLYDNFVNIGARPKTIISDKAEIGNFDVEIGYGTTIMSGTIITNSISIGKGCLINLNCTIGHDCIIEDFVEMSPNVNLSGRCSIGKFSNIGTNAIILPNINIGKNSIIGAGSVVTKDIPPNSLAVGTPAKVIKIKNNE